MCLLNFRGRKLTEKVSHKNTVLLHIQSLDTVHSMLFESDRMWIKSLVFREAHDANMNTNCYRDSLLLFYFILFLILMKYTHKKTHVWHSLLSLILHGPSHSVFIKTPQSFSQQNLFHCNWFTWVCSSELQEVGCRRLKVTKIAFSLISGLILVLHRNIIQLMY